MNEEIRRRALELGFDACGFAAARPLDHLRDFYRHFLDEERQATMAYLDRYAPQRIDPELLLSGVKTVIAVLINYYPPELLSGDDNFVISKYAYGKRYPQLIKTKLQPLAAFVDSIGKAGSSSKIFVDSGPVLEKLSGSLGGAGTTSKIFVDSGPALEKLSGSLGGAGTTSKIFVDSGPVLEKAWAQSCGIGWQGKNTLIINPSMGSFVFIGIILTSVEIEPDKKKADHCGSCTRCMDACPTGAIDRPYQLNIRRCISYGTLVKNAEMPAEVRAKLDGKIFGCDICQDVCPYNRKVKPTTETWFHPSEALKRMRRNDWINLTKEQYEDWFASDALGDMGYEGLMKNVRNAV